MHVGVEARRIRPLEFFEERLFVATVPDVIANVIGICKRQDDQIMSAPIAECARTGSLRLFVLGFAVNDGSSGFAGIFAYAFPDAHHVATRRINNLTTA